MSLTLLLKRLFPLLIVIFLNVIGFGLVFFQKGDADRTVLYFSLGLIGLMLVTYCVILFCAPGDDYLFLVASMLVSIGLIMLYRLGTASVIRQIVWFYAGIAGFYISFFLFSRYNVWRKLAVLYVASAVILFLATLTVGKSIGGAKNWIVIGDFSVQPSEIIKLLLILATASIYTYRSKIKALVWFYSTSFRRECAVLLVAYIFFGFLVLQREWGAALLNFCVLFCLQYVFGSNKLFLIGNMSVAGVAAILGALFLTHIQTRLHIWQDPFIASNEGGYQIVQSLYAMASGGFMGSGLGLGAPHLIPLVKSDFIFAAICEELGSLGGVAVILLLFVLVYRGVKISLLSQDPFKKAVSLGISMMYGFQAFIIIGGTTKFIPLTGITLPFISAGGSSLLASFVALGMLQAISLDK